MEGGTQNERWTPAPGRPVLRADEVHVWRANVDEITPALGEMERVLSAEEHTRAGRFRFARHRQRFIVQRAVLRRVLARYLDVSPAALNFSFGSHGKPALADGGKDAPSFNVSHSAGIALYAVTQHREVGIDVEWCLRRVDHVGIARRFFSAREAEALSVLPREQRGAAFFALWTCKEATLKAIGRGLFFPMNRVEVSLDAGNQPTLESIAGDESAARRWSCKELVPAEDHVATLVAEGNGWKVDRWRYVFDQRCGD